MMTFERTDEFNRWLRDLDVNAQAKVLVRIDRLSLGNPGDVSPVGEGVSELRIHSGPGYRVYYKQQGNVATLLHGGTKSSQKADIAKAKKLAAGLET
jgi:putative addiction module killer protein